MLSSLNPEMNQIINEFASEATFAPETDIGYASEILGKVIGGDSSDWTVKTLGIPAMDIEIGSKADYHKKTWFPRNVKTAFTIMEDNMGYIEYTFDKIGNQITIEPIGYTKN